MRFLKRVAQSVTLLILKHSSLSLSHYCAFKDLKPQLLMISKDLIGNLHITSIHFLYVRCPFSISHNPPFKFTTPSN